MTPCCSILSGSCTNSLFLEVMLKALAFHAFLLGIKEMELLCMQTRISPILIFLSISSLLSPTFQAHPLTTTTIAGTIQRTTDEQTLASISPDPDHNSELFLTSPSGKYSAYLLRSAASGSLDDSCYIQLTETRTGEAVWTSGCAPVSNAETCSLVFTFTGLEIFYGGQLGWNAASEGGHAVTLELVDDGDLRIINEEGQLAWKASDEPHASQGCASAPAAAPPIDSPVMVAPPPSELVPESPPVSASPLPELAPQSPPDLASPLPELAPASTPVLAPPPFSVPGSPAVAASTGGGRLPFGRPAKGSAAALNQDQPLSTAATQQPLVDNTPYQSGSWMAKDSFSGVGFGFLALAAHVVLLFKAF